MRKTLAQIAKLVGGELVGDPRLVITGLSGVKEAKPGDLTFIANPKYIPFSKTTKASAIITPRSVEIPGKSIIRADNPSLAFSRAAAFFTQDTVCRPKGVHKTAVIAGDAVIGKNVAVGPYTVIEGGAVVGDNTVIYSNCYVGHCTVVGKDCLIYPHVTLREGITVGDRVIVHSGAVIGADGFGYVWVNGKHEKIPQVGTVVVENDVEIGANATIDRARFDKTVIGDGSKIDNLVQVAHNVIMGKHCIIISQVGISGSVVIGDNVVLAGQVGVHGHLTIGKGVIAAARAAITKSIPAGEKISGFPAQPFMAEQRLQATLRRVPSYIKTILDLEKRVAELEKKLDNV
ncbi:MAG: UDP-3-O-(3-hydroxymyristoyl)glucosamine N-acyltransferase [Candidatus Omnitrophica bacterium]|nr:UDP-3-O-(3-hydroxymyristoyl)glucosamine N-acyltransferase [Candidatus Omnitrophota bacterium]